MRHSGISPFGQVRAWLVAMILGLAGLGVLAPGAAAVPADFWGVSPQAAPTVEQLQRLRKGGVDSIRIGISWNAAQPQKGAAPDFTASDSLIGGAARAGLNVLPFVYDAPSWAVPRVKVPGPTTARAPATLPVKTGAERAAWSAFLAQVVERYGPSGRFWSENPALPADPIGTWQIWNEPNFKYFVAHPNPVEYGQLVRASFATVRSVDPGGQVVLAGLFSQPGEAGHFKPPRAYFAADFLERMYRSTPGIRSRFQGVALHPYTGSFKRLAPEIEEFRQVLARNHDSGKGLWITEIGWSSEPFGQEHDSFAKGPAGQARELKAAFSLFAHKAAKWRLKRIYWFSVDDAPPGVCNFCGGSGLFAKGFVPKKSWYAYVKFAGGTP